MLGGLRTPRLDRRGRQDELEAWCANRLLKTLDAHQKLDYPLTVTPVDQPRQPPDFIVEIATRRFELEVTEACSEAEQISRTDFAKQPGLVLRDTMPFDDACRKKSLVADLVHSIEKKALKSNSSPKWHLLVYMNTDAVSFEEVTKVREWLCEVPRDLRQYFSRTWCLYEGGVIELRDLTHYAITEP